MTPFLDVPFLPEDGYVEFLHDCEQEIDSVQFSLHNRSRLDSRILFLEAPEPRDRSIELLGQLPGPRKYGLLNSRFYGPDLFTDRQVLKSLINKLDRCAAAGVLNGIIYCDHYLLQLLSDEAPGLAGALEAVPGINTMLDSQAKVEAQLGYIGETRFLQPKKIILDRSLNRDLDQLADTARLCRRSFPDVKLELLANEGCLAQCPFKLSHDAYIALANLQERDCTCLLNRELGCMRLVDEQPHRILQSPFIRPEDMDLYLYHVDTIKLCGRTLGSGFLQQAIAAYMDRRYDGNLLDLLDAMQWLTPSLYIDNASLSFDFANMLSICKNKCDSCGFCRELFVSISRPLPVELPDNRVAVD
jgi:collagenase-like PrtC family protease